MPSSRRRVDGVEAMIQRLRRRAARNLISTTTTASRSWASCRYLLFVASLVLFVKDMPEQDGEPGNLFKGPIFAAVMVAISA